MNGGLVLLVSLLGLALGGVDWFLLVQYSTFPPPGEDEDWFGLVWFGLAWLVGLVWLGRVDFLPHGAAHIQTGESSLHLQVRIRIGLVWFGFVWVAFAPRGKAHVEVRIRIGLVWFSLVYLVWFGLVFTSRLG
jgi:hypothetical protein